jgi:hypothetical protein
VHIYDSEYGGLKLGVQGVSGARNIAEWKVDQTRKVRISGYEAALLPMTLTSPTTGSPVTVQVMRVYLKELDGVAGSYEWNMASKQGQAVLNEILKRPDFESLLLEVTRQGAPPKTKWIMRVL